MKKERIKSTALIILIISSLFLTCQIWFNDKLWPDGYSFFRDMHISDKIAGFFGVSGGKPSEQIQASIVSPSHLAAYTVKNFDHAIAVTDDTFDTYSEVNDFVASTVTSAFSTAAKSITRVDEAAWQKALFTRGFYVDYGISYKSSTFAGLLGISSSPLTEQIPRVRRFIITAEDGLVSDVSVFVAGEADNSFYKISTGVSKSSFTNVISLLSEQASAKKRFSFFINADIATGTADEAVFAPYLILNEEASRYNNITAVNPLMRDNGISMHTADKILRAFSINPNNVGKSTDANDNIIFVESRATLKITTDGSIIYTAAASKSSPLGNASATDTVSTINEAVKLLELVSSPALEGDTTKLYMSGLEEENGNIKITFDYTYGGIPIIFSGNYEGRHAVSMEFENGVLKSYHQLLRRYEPSEDTTLIPSTYDAVNDIFSALSTDERENRIENIFPAYSDDGLDGEKEPSWFLKLEQTDGFKN